MRSDRGIPGEGEEEEEDEEGRGRGKRRRRSGAHEVSDVMG
jgi:hypothetical protein